MKSHPVLFLRDPPSINPEESLGIVIQHLGEDDRIHIPDLNQKTCDVSDMLRLVKRIFRTGSELI